MIRFMIVACLLFGVSARADETCSLPQFQVPPAFGTDGNFDIILISDCQLTEIDLSFSTLNDLLVQNTVHLNQVNGGPTPDASSEIPGVIYDVTNSSTDSHGDTMSLRSDVHIATDGKTKLIYENLSTDINATDDSKNLKQMDVVFTVTLVSQGSYLVHFSHIVHISKPWYAPVGIFKSQSEKSPTIS
jgi:hypothetical protein